MRDDYPKPLTEGDGAPFWEFCRRHELRVQRCESCGHYRHHPRPRCPNCRSDDFAWAECSGTGSVYSYTICHPPVLPAFADAVPYNVAVIELAEGPFMVSNIVDCPNEDLFVGMAVELCFVEIDEELTIPQFRPVTDAR
jgi:uncharacterized OB-fold protein